MRVIALRRLREFWDLHPEAEQPLRAWFKDAEGANWATPGDIRKRYASASFLPRDRVVFNIAGNNYRLVVVVRYPYHTVYVRFVGTHAEYDRADVENA